MKVLIGNMNSRILGGAFLLLLSSISVFGQQSTCDLRIHLFKSSFINSDSGGGWITTFDRASALGDGKAVAYSVDTNAAYRAKVFSRTLYFVGLEKGSYSVRVYKEGFVSTSQEVYVDCNKATEQQLICEAIGLKPGTGNDPVINAPRVMRLDRLTVLGQRSPVEERCDYPLPPAYRTISGGLVNGKAISLVRPSYPKNINPAVESAIVSVLVIIDTDGSVVRASPVSGKKSFHEVAIEAALATRFSPLVVGGEMVKVSGVLTYKIDPPK